MDVSAIRTMLQAIQTDTEANSTRIEGLDDRKVESVFGRTGKAIMKSSGDYGTHDVTNDSAVSGSTCTDALEYLEENKQNSLQFITVANTGTQDLHDENVAIAWSLVCSYGSELTLDGSDSTKINVGTTGYYRVSCNVTCGTDGSSVTWQVNQSGSILFAEVYAHGECSTSVSYIVQLTAGSYIQVVGNDSLGTGPCNILQNDCVLTLEYIRS